MYNADAEHSNVALQQKLLSLYDLRSDSVRVNLGSDRTQRQPYKTLLNRLDNPQNKLPPTIHVSGTNGKGSTIAFIKSICQDAGYTVHRYTSPHLYQFNERIVLRNNIVDDKTLEEALDRVLLHCNDLPLTFFEVTTALAFLLFSEHEADIVLLETGVGGRLDCTNVVEEPLATIITSIGLDHMEFLGTTISDIAHEKSGIIKAGAPCFTPATQNNEAYQAIQDKANSVGITLHRIDPLDPTIELGLMGTHQYSNAALAKACIETLPNLKIPNDTIYSGLRNAKWPARMEQIKTAHLPKDWTLWFDGAHNEDAALCLAKTLELMHKKNADKPIYIICGMMKRKDPAAFIAPIASHVNAVYCIPVHNHSDCFSPEEIRQRLQDNIDPDTPVIAAKSLEDALSAITEQALAGTILIAGSLYLYEGLNKI